MKIRAGFVSNSSSSSFVINKANLNYEQIDQILNHIDVAGDEAWRIREDYARIFGDTCMDNFDMDKFLRDIGVKDEYVTWGS